MKKILFFVLAFMSFSEVASAHEAYVLDKTFFWENLRGPWNTHALDALKDPHNLRVSLGIAIGVLILLGLNLVFRNSSAGEKANRTLEQLSPIGPIFIRATIALSFFFSALTWSFLGPELSIHMMPFAAIIRIALFAISFLIAAGLFTEIAALAALIIFTFGFFVFGSYLLTYLSYLGEIIALLLFGMRKWSFDRYIFGLISHFENFKKYGTIIIRICYGAVLVYAAITVKLLHPALTIKVVNDWNLTQFHWLFPSDPLLVTLGAGLTELAIGLFIIFGFELRLAVLVSLFYLTLSLFYFRELVWPHLILYGISLDLLVQPEIFTLDHLIFKGKRWRFWQRSLLPHTSDEQIN